MESDSKSRFYRWTLPLKSGLSGRSLPNQSQLTTDGAGTAIDLATLIAMNTMNDSNRHQQGEKQILGMIEIDTSWESHTPLQR